MITREDEDALVHAVIADPEQHVIVDEENYDKGHRVLLTRDGLRIFLHRQLYKRVIGTLDPNEFLVKSCDSEWCVNPLHFILSAGPGGNRKGYCRNGHEYTEADLRSNGGRECRQCAREREQRRVRKRVRGGNPHYVTERNRRFCPHGHRYTTSNTYIWTDKKGNDHRKCKTCTVIRANGGDPSEVG